MGIGALLFSNIGKPVKKNLLKAVNKFQMPYATPNTNAPNPCVMALFSLLNQFCLK